MIVRLGLINRHVDLAHIQSVGEARFFNRMGSGGWFCGFDIDFLLQDMPRRYEWPAEECGGVRYHDGKHQLEYVDGYWSHWDREPGHGELVCLRNLNGRILKEIIEPWKQWKDHGSIIETP
jgi:hypothetical protein